MLINLLIVLVLAGLTLWALAQVPLDATIARLIRVVVIVAVVLYCLSALLGRNPLAMLR